MPQHPKQDPRLEGLLERLLASAKPGPQGIEVPKVPSGGGSVATLRLPGGVVEPPSPPPTVGQDKRITPELLGQLTSPSNPSVAKFGVESVEKVYKKNGRFVVDTARPDEQGMVPTHFVDWKEGRLETETWEVYEDRVLSKDFTPADTVQDNNIGSLEAEVIGPLHALMREAKGHGFNMAITETERSQGRQEELFRVGRVTGDKRSPITWTLTSAHTLGRAADLIINEDSTGSDPGYKWLRDNAKRFGFTSIGAADPGHIAFIGKASPSARASR